LPEITKFRELSSTEEDQLERKITWIICHGRSGSTWLAEKLLLNPENIIWNEPFIGFHLQVSERAENPETGEITYERTFDQEQQNSDRYFFSKLHENTWKPAFRKFFLSRTFSQTKTLQKNVIIKEPTANGSADIILGCLPESKFIFLLRDGRDIVDSRIAAHGKNTWLKLAPLDEKKRKIRIKLYSYQWNHGTRIMWKAYQQFNPNRRLFVKYEDLRINTVPELKKIYNFIGVKIEDKELEKIVDLNSFEKIPESEKGPEKFNRTALVSGYKNNFNKDEQKVMNSIMGDLLKQFDYKI